VLEVQIKEQEAVTVMSLPFTGPYEQTRSKLEHLMSWLLRAGHPYSGKPLGCYYDDPAKVPADQLRAEVCLPIEETCEGQEEIVRKTLPSVTVACAVFTGPYSDAHLAYEQIFEWMGAHGYRHVQGEPTREVFLNMYAQEEESAEPATEVQVPVEPL
jgi:effector-binding domain-containing protein